MTRVVIADDHPFLRTGVEAVLRSAGIEIAGSAGDGNEALQVIARCDPDVAIIDVQMPDRDGIGVLEAMRTDGDQRPVILLTAHIDDDRLIAALRANVNAIVFKQGAEQSLVETIERVGRGEKVIDPALTSRALDLTLTGVGTLDRLAPRERQIADAVAKGLRNREIGAQLGMTEGSIKVYLNRIFDKVGVENRTELAILVHGKGRS
ncbi:MAG: response regulator transcription factor [Novosphingobium sp.]|uniref:response regulator n=1 Tax=Novosphingobium sp. TaxID=1874826 RepID=UPI001DC9A397|nr:response regulator transcription factor [Novosphingobium sp.]MCB2057180.1 response regulator transcription factor [Novosphingobium sp.]MCP5386703.1 response regulator transcription factor [Novosphingobium sp.]